MLSFPLLNNISAGEVIEVIKANAPDWLENVDIVDLYENKARETRNVTFELQFSNENNQRTADEVTNKTFELAKAVENKLGIRLQSTAEWASGRP
jgi:phenylalanyl-tRNA synthetase beta subunit